MERWYLACHKSGRHNAFKAQLFLAKMGITVFIPQRCCRLQRSDRPGHFRKVLEPLFPGYLFIYFDYEVHHSSIVTATPGISHFVRFGEIIKPLQDAMVDDIMRWTLVIDHESFPDSRDNVKAMIPCQEGDIIPAEQQILHQKIKTIIDEPHGETRSALFYAFIESNRENKAS